MSIHPTAIIEPGAKVGRDVEIGPYCLVGGSVVLGDGCKLHHHATVEGCTTLGEGCEVFPQAVLGCRPQDLKFGGERTLLEIGDHNIFREQVTVHPGTANGGGVTRIGDNNMLLVGVHIAHDCLIGNRCIIANYVQFAGHVHVEDHANMGGHSAVHHFVTVGKHAFVGGMTRVSADVPPFMVVVAARGTRSEVRMVNGVGLQRSGYTSDEINALKGVFVRLFSRRARATGTAIQDRVEAILAEGSLNEHVEYLCRFLMRSFAHGRHGRYLESLRADPVNRNTWKPNTKHTLTVHVVGQGSVSRAPSGNGEQAAAIVELHATADPGWRFVGWDGSCSGESNPARVVVDASKTVTARFAEVS